MYDFHLMATRLTATQDRHYRKEYVREVKACTARFDAMKKNGKTALLIDAWNITSKSVSTRLRLTPRELNTILRAPRDVDIRNPAKAIEHPEAPEILCRIGMLSRSTDALTALLGGNNPDFVARWPRRRNHHALFGGQRPLMLLKYGHSKEMTVLMHHLMNV